jgi:hypothetical protein
VLDDEMLMALPPEDIVKGDRPAWKRSRRTAFAIRSAIRHPAGRTRRDGRSATRPALRIGARAVALSFKRGQEPLALS